MTEEKRALIFGAGGFVGSYLALELRAHGYEVSGADLARSDALPDFVRFFAGDILDANAVGEIVRAVSPTHIVNLAAISSVGQCWRIPARAVAVNVEGALNVLEAARALEKSPKVLLIGSSEEYAPSDRPISEEGAIDSNNPYGLTKMMQEKFADLYRERYGMHILRVRSFNHTGVGQSDAFVLPSWCKQAAEIARAGRPGVIRVGNLDVLRDFSDVRDVVRAYRLVLERGKTDRVYNVGSGAAHSLRALIGQIAAFAGANVAIEVDADRLRPDDTPSICCDNARIRAELGWSPEHGIFETLKWLYEHYLARGRE